MGDEAKFFAEMPSFLEIEEPMEDPLATLDEHAIMGEREENMMDGIE